MKPTYYNEIDAFAAHTLRNLIAAGHIAPGDVDERSIEDVHPSDLKPYTQCHFFASIGVWSYALRRAGWPDDRPVWTGSCPCQPFSSAGEGAGFDDERHLWPHFFHLIEQRRPPAIFGEQVASRDANPWIDLVQDDLEGLGYGFGAVPFPSASVGAPHIRDRLYWMAYANSNRRDKQRRESGKQTGQKIWRHQSDDRSEPCGLDYAHNSGLEGLGGGYQAPFKHGQGTIRPVAPASEPSRLAYSDQHGCIALPLDRGHDKEHHAEPCGELGRLEHSGQHDDSSESAATGAGYTKAYGSTDQLGRPNIPSCAGPGPTNGLWSAADWLLCRDGKWRPVEPGTFPLASRPPSELGRVQPGLSKLYGRNRTGRLRAYGNAINAEQARVFIEAGMSCMP